jgi:dTDP-4-amino-4,6-dideoxygalactose transaminase
MSSFQGIPLGKSGDVSIFSFQKSLGTPDGGALVVNEETLAIPRSEGKPTFLTTLRGIVVLGLQHKHMFYSWCYALLNLLVIQPARWILQFLKKRQPKDFKIQTASTVDFDDLKASLGISAFSLKQIQLSDLKMMFEKRRDNFERLRSFLPKAYLVQMVFPSLAEGVCPLFLPMKFSDRKKAKEFLEGRGIETFIFGEFLHKNLPQGQYLDAERSSREILCMPIHQDMNDAHVEYLGQSLREFYAGRLA